MSLPFPKSVLTQHVIALGKTRSGKSSKMRLIVEHLLDHDEPTCIIDPKGDWWGIKSSADGKHAGYPVVIFGGEHADVALNPRAGAAVAELIATGNRPSLIDLGGWMVGERTQFFIDFASTWFKVARGHRKLVIDEVHNFAPKGKILDPQAGRMLHWANRLASEAAGKGTIIIAASQRPQKVHNDFLTSCETLIACKVIHKADRDAIKDWVDGCADPAVGRQMIGELANMERPEAWVWSPEAAFGPKRITFPLYRTYDSFKPQEPQAAKLKGWAEVDLDEVRAKLQTVVAEAEANDPKMLRKRIADLEQQLKGIGGLRPEETRAAQDTGYRRGIEDGLQDGRRQYEILRAFATESLEAQRLKLIGAAEALQARELPVWQDSAQMAVTMHPAPSALKPATRQALEHVAGAAARQVSTRLKPGASPGQNGAGEKLPRAERALLTVLAQHRAGRTRVQLAVLSGYSIKSSSFANALGALRSAGYATKGEPIRATEAGIAVLGDWEPLPTGDALRFYWLDQLPKAERSLLHACFNAPEPLTKEALAQASGYSVTSSSFANALGRLRSLELVSRGSEIHANEDLFG